MKKNAMKKIYVIAIVIIVVGSLLFLFIPHSRSDGWQFVLALLTLVIAFLAWTVTDAQREIAQATLKHDLFDRRVKVYDAAQLLMARARDYGVNLWKAKQEFDDACRGARFIFQPDLVVYLDSLSERHGQLALWRTKKAERAEANLDYDDLGRKEYEMEMEMLAEWKVLPDRFAPYLDLRNWQ
ncbi:hypothetical protein D9M68_370400 [compost metagenome]